MQLVMYKYIADILLEAGADIMAVDSGRNTALHLACENVSFYVQNFIVNLSCCFAFMYSIHFVSHAIPIFDVTSIHNIKIL